MNIAALIQPRGPARRNHHGRVVLLDNEWPSAPGGCEAGSTDHRRLDKAIGGTEVARASLGLAACGPLRLRRRGLIELRRSTDGEPADDAQRDALHRFSVCAVSVVSFMLVAK